MLRNSLSLDNFDTFYDEDLKHFRAAIENREESGFDVNTVGEDGLTGFHKACQSAEGEPIVRLLLQQREETGFDVDIVTESNNMWDLETTGFYIACACGHLNIVRLLLETEDETNLDVNRPSPNGNTPLMEAYHRSQMDVVRMLLHERVLQQTRLDVNATGTDDEVSIERNSIFAEACARGDEETIQLLIDTQQISDLDVNTFNGNRETAFQLACRMNQMDVLILLLENREQIGLDLTQVGDEDHFWLDLFPFMLTVIKSASGVY